MSKKNESERKTSDYFYTAILLIFGTGIGFIFGLIYDEFYSWALIGGMAGLLIGAVIDMYDKK